MTKNYRRYSVKMYGTMVFVLIATFGIYNIVFNHVDPLSFCYIDIDSDTLRGERKTVKQALTELKKEDPATYKKVCKSVDVVNEKWCILGDKRGDSTYKEPITGGCFVRGTHTIYINPSKSTSPKTVDTRTEQIARYGTYAYDFWN